MGYSVVFSDAEHHQILPNLHVGGHIWYADGRYQGASDSTVHDDESWRYVLSMYSDLGCLESVPQCDTRFLFFEDTEAGIKEETWVKIHDAVDSVVFNLKADRKVLIRCLAGFNRTGLVASMVLIRLGMTADSAIELLRERHSPYVLINPVFEGYVRHKSFLWVTGDSVDERLLRDGDGNVDL